MIVSLSNNHFTSSTQIQLIPLESQSDHTSIPLYLDQSSTDLLPYDTVGVANYEEIERRIEKIRSRICKNLEYATALHDRYPTTSKRLKKCLSELELNMRPHTEEAVIWHRYRCSQRICTSCRNHRNGQKHKQLFPKVTAFMKGRHTYLVTLVYPSLFELPSVESINDSIQKVLGLPFLTKYGIEGGIKNIDPVGSSVENQSLHLHAHIMLFAKNAIPHSVESQMREEWGNIIPYSTQVDIEKVAYDPDKVLGYVLKSFTSVPPEYVVHVYEWSLRRHLTVQFGNFRQFRCPIIGQSKHKKWKDHSKALEDQKYPLVPRRIHKRKFIR